MAEWKQCWRELELIGRSRSGTVGQQRHETATAAWDNNNQHGRTAVERLGRVGVLFNYETSNICLDQTCVYMYNISQGWQKIE